MRTIILVLLALVLLAACEPEYLTADRLEPIEQEMLIHDARGEFDALIYEHDARIADLYSRLSSSEEKVSFDVTRAKRQLIGNRHSQRSDVTDLIDSHAHSALSEIARSRSRIERFESDARSALAQQRLRIDRLDPESASSDQVEQILDEAREALEHEELEEWTNSAEEASVRAAESIQNELNKIRT